MTRRACLLLAAVLLPSCSAMQDEPRGPQDLAATQRAKDLLWIVESDSGTAISSATAFGPGRLVTTATSVEDWVGLPLRVRRNGTVLPVRAMQLAVHQNFAILQVQEPGLQAPQAAADPAPNQRLFMAAANGGNVFDGGGPVVPLSAPVDGIANPRDVVVAELPAARGFAGGPVVDSGGNLIGIASGVLRGGVVDPAVPASVTPGSRVPHRSVIVLPVRVIDRTMQQEGLR
ncbi:trypsin-like peptidase domain-containing protein [Neoroseomonas marina]|nr:trypsin-like peptidase domain-containing protein [Neoroseomonas marina]